jgi:predicted negative regulator of RcsB-dependent stress response
MDQGRWKTVNHIFHAALELSANERHSFVLTASEGDPDLQAEVELLLQADENAGSYLESPLLHGELFSHSASPVSPGDVLCGRFCILRAVGEGGMGHVFEALDSELAVHVAIKIIRPEIAANPEALARFRQEVRLARRITHPNVCRTFDLERETRAVDPARGTKQEVVFLTMEFLQGETLASRIKRTGALPLDEALHIARQVADALHAANTLGIVHRDMKPANIMLVPAEASAPHGFRAVITDFGLARIDAVVSSGNRSALSHTARPIGTLAYMAPEQLEGSTVSPATDIYAFGLVLFEMVTGTRAFPSDNFLSGIAQRLTGSPPSPQSIVPTLPLPWTRTIECCLRLKPADRFQSSADAIDVLDGSRTKLPPVGKRSIVQRLTLATWTLPRRLLTLVAILLAAVALFVSGFRLYRSAANSKVAPGALVYMTQVKNQTGEKAFDNLTELIQAGLAQSVQINLLDQGRVGDLLQQMTKAPDTVIDPPTAREIAMRAGAVRVVFATVTESAGSYSLNIDIQQPDNTPARFHDHWTKSFAWNTSDSTKVIGSIPPELLSKVRSASNWIRNKAGESADDIARLDAPPEDVTTGNWQALAEYTNAERLNALRQQEDAVIALQNAVRIDPQFALAYARLGDVLLSLNRSVDGYRAYSMALAAGEQSRLTRHERDRIRGIYALDTADYQTAESLFHDFTVYYDKDYLGWFYRAAALMMLDRTQEAAANLQRAISLRPSGSSAPYTLAFFEYILHDDAAARHWGGYLRQNGHPDEANLLDAEDSFLNNRYDEAESRLRLLQSAHEGLLRSISYSYLGHLAADRGNFQHAIDLLTEGIEADQSTGSGAEEAMKHIDRAFIECQVQQFQRCIDDEESAISLNPSLTTYRLTSMLFGEAVPTAPAPIASKMRRLLLANERQMPKEDLGPISEVTQAQVRGEIMLCEGRSKAALSQFRKAAVLDAPSDPKEYLARALVRVAEGEHDSRLRASLLEEAARYYQKIALEPAYIWYSTSRNLYPPGYWADGMGVWLRIAPKHNPTDATYNRILKELALLRPQEFAQLSNPREVLKQ